MKISVSHNYNEIAAMFKRIGANVQRNMATRINSSIFEDRVQAIVETEIDKLGFASRAAFLKKSFKALVAEVTSNGIVYRITSNSTQAERINEGTPPSSVYTLGTTQGEDGLYSSLTPTRFMDKIEEKVQALLYEEIALAVSEACSHEGF